MTVLAPPPPQHDELEALIREARARQRRRWVLVAAAVLGVSGIGIALWAVLAGRGTVSAHGRGPISGPLGPVSGRSAIRRRGVGEVGSSGGVTWVMNGRGLWLTANGGRAWRKVAIPRGTGFLDKQGSSVQFVDRRHGWISINELTGYPPHRGERWMFARTTDGGRTWIPAFPPDCHVRCGGGGMDFLDARHGYLLAGGGPGVGIENQLFRTADGGRTWQAVSKTSVGGSITFLDNRIGFLGWFGGGPQFYWGPPFGTLYRTTDGGRTWSKYDIGGSKSFVEAPIGVGGRHVVVVQNGPSPRGALNIAPGTIYVSTDGRHWTDSAVPGKPSGESSFSAISPNVWVYSSGRVLFATEDAGRHWRRISLHGLVTRHLHRPPIWRAEVNFTSSRVGWVLVNRKLYRTTDGGSRWRVAGPPKGKPIPVHACKPAQLTMSFWSTPTRLRDATAVLQLGNVGRLGCRLSGWPTVVAIEADGTRVRAKPISPRTWKRPGRPFALGPGRSVWAVVGGRPANGPGSCPKAVRLRVAPPGGHRATTLVGPWGRESGRTFFFPLCSGISVTPVFRP